MNNKEKIAELKATIEKAQKQIEELEKAGNTWKPQERKHVLLVLR